MGNYVVVLFVLQQQRPSTLDVESAVAKDLGPVHPDGDDYERSHIPHGRPEERIREEGADCTCKTLTTAMSPSGSSKIL